MDSSGHPPDRPGGPSNKSQAVDKVTGNTNKNSSKNMERIQELCQNYIQHKPCACFRRGKCILVHDDVNRNEWAQSEIGRNTSAKRSNKQKKVSNTRGETKGLAATAFAAPQVSGASVTTFSAPRQENIKPKTSEPATAGAAMNKTPASDRARPQRAAATFGPMASSALSNIHKHLDIAPKDKRQLAATKPAFREGSVKSSSDTQSNVPVGHRTPDTQQKTQSKRATGGKPTGDIKQDASTLADNRKKQGDERSMPINAGRNSQVAVDFKGVSINKTMGKLEIQASRAVESTYYPDSATFGQAMHNVWCQHGDASVATKNGLRLDFLRSNKAAFATNQVPYTSGNSSLPRNSGSMPLISASVPLKDLAASKRFGNKLDFALNDNLFGVTASSVIVDDKTGTIRIGVYIPPSAMSQMLAKAKDGSLNLDISIASSDQELSGADAATGHTSTEHATHSKMSILPSDTRSITELIKMSRENGSCQLFLKGFPCDKHKTCKFYHDVALRDANMANVCPDNLRGMSCQRMRSCIAWHKPLELLSAVATERYAPESRQPEVCSLAQTEFSQRSTRNANIGAKKEHSIIPLTGEKASTETSSVGNSKEKVQVCSLYLRGCCEFSNEGAIKHPSLVTQGLYYVHDLRMFQEFQKISKADRSLCRNFLAGSKCATSPCQYKHKDEARRQLLALAKGRRELPGSQAVPPNSAPEIEPFQFCEPFTVSGVCLRQNSCPYTHDVFMQNELRTIGNNLCKKFLIDVKCDSKCLRAHNQAARGRLWDAWAVANGLINESDLEPPVRGPAPLMKDRLAAAYIDVDNSKGVSTMPASKPQDGRVPQTSRADARTMAPQWGSDKLSSPADFATYLSEKYPKKGYPKKGARSKEDEQPAWPDADEAINNEGAVDADGFPNLAAAVFGQSDEANAAQFGQVTDKIESPHGEDVVKAHINDGKEGVDLETRSDVSDEPTILIHRAVDLGKSEPGDGSKDKHTEEFTSSCKEVSVVSPELVKLPESDNEQSPKTKRDDLAHDRQSSTKQGPMSTSATTIDEDIVKSATQAKTKTDDKGLWPDLLTSSDAEDALARSAKNYGSLTDYGSSRPSLYSRLLAHAANAGTLSFDNPEKDDSVSSGW